MATTRKNEPWACISFLYLTAALFSQQFPAMLTKNKGLHKDKSPERLSLRHLRELPLPSILGRLAMRL
jgi:hypothetical protein